MAKWLLRDVLLDGDKPADIFDPAPVPDLPDDAVELDAAVEVGSAELAQLRSDNERLTRINGEYFACIESMERQRDEWREMFFTHSGEHQAAQAMIRDSATELSQQLRAAVAQLNIYREAAAHTAIVEPKCLEQVPTSIPEDFKKRMDALVAGKKHPDTDAKAERDAIDAANAG